MSSPRAPRLERRPTAQFWDLRPSNGTLANWNGCIHYPRVVAFCVPELLGSSGCVFVRYSLPDCNPPPSKRVITYLSTGYGLQFLRKCTGANGRHGTPRKPTGSLCCFHTNIQKLPGTHGRMYSRNPALQILATHRKLVLSLPTSPKVSGNFWELMGERNKPGTCTPSSGSLGLMLFELVFILLIKYLYELL